MPPVGDPQAAVADAVDVLESTPRTGANRCCLTPVLRTVTWVALSAVTVAVDEQWLRFEVAKVWAVLARRTACVQAAVLSDGQSAGVGTGLQLLSLGVHGCHVDRDGSEADERHHQ